MSVMVNLSPQMENDVREYVTQNSDELANLFISYLTKELERRREARRNPLAKYIGCIADGRRTDDVVSRERRLIENPWAKYCGCISKEESAALKAHVAAQDVVDEES